MKIRIHIELDGLAELESHPELVALLRAATAGRPAAPAGDSCQEPSPELLREIEESREEDEP